MATRKKKKETAKQAKTTASQQSPQRRRPPGQAVQSSSILDERAHRDIAGVVFIVFAVALLLLAVMPSEGALVGNAISSGLHLLLGAGCYILPVVLLIIGITFIGRFERERVPLRAAIGLSIIFVALLAFMALFAPISVLGKDEPDLLFSDKSLTGFGGYIGSGIAWCGIVLFGRVVTGVILVGIMIVGLIIIGFSISRLIEKANAHRRSLGSQIQEHGVNSGSAGFARIRRGTPNGAIGPDQVRLLSSEAANLSFDPNQTAVLNPLGGQDGISGGEPIVEDDYELYEDDQFYSEQATRPLMASGSLASGSRNASQGSIQAMPLEGAYQADGHDASSNRRRPVGSVDTAAMTRPLRSASNLADEAESNPSQRKKKARKSTSPDSFEQLDLSAQKASSSGEGGFALPPMKLLNASRRTRKRAGADAALASTSNRLQQVMGDFGIDATVVDWVAGPTVTLFEVDLPAGVRVSRVTALSDDIALALASPGVRIFAPVPGTNYVGIEVPNENRETVLLSDVLKDAPEGPLQIAIGKDVEGRSIVSDLAKMPHLLIGGTTGSGKSVAINAMIMSILMRATPDEVRFIMIDPKRVEFTPYNGIPHLYVPVVTEPKEAASALSWGVAEMERRLKVFSKVGARNIAQYNAKAERELEKQAGSGDAPDADDAQSNGLDADGKDEIAWAKLPYIVIIIDELADLMMNIGKEVELSISRIAQLARAAGIHLIVATQRPSTNVVTGLIKANITNRIAFNVASGIDSRVILDTTGAESLIGLGDMLLSKPELSKPQRIQACFVTEEEIARVVDFVKDQSSPEYHSEILQTNLYTIGSTDPHGGPANGNHDPLLWEAADIVVSSGMGSTSNLQRRLKVGYSRAGRIMDQLEEMGIVGPANGSRPREVMVDEMELETVKAFESQEA